MARTKIKKFNVKSRKDHLNTRPFNLVSEKQLLPIMMETMTDRADGPTANGDEDHSDVL